LPRFKAKEMTVNTTRNTVLEIVRIFDAPPQRVFDAWMVRENWQSWIGPEGINCEVPQLDAKAGGRYRINMKLTSGEELPVGGNYQIIEPHERIVFTWGKDGDPARQSTITLLFRDLGSKTELTLRQEGLPTIESRGDHTKGWNSAFNKLERYLAG
jgi:uncharacterized protein YndB with AHSA1/START domain